jgi:hypothetical protein
MDRNNKVVRQRATDLASLRPTTNTHNVSSTNELQSLKAYIDEQQEQMQRIVGDIQNDHKRLVRALDKSIIANLPSHEVELREYTCDSSATGCHDQSQPLYGMPIDMYPGQQQPPTHIGDKFSDLRMSGPSARERGLSRPAAADPIFRSDLPRPAPKPPHTVQTLDNPFGPSAYDARQSEYNARWSGHMAGQVAHVTGRSTYLTGRSDTEYFKEDGYPTPHPSQLNSPSHHATHQHHNITYQTCESEYFPASRMPERNDQSYEPHRARITAPQNPNQWGGKQHTNIKTTSPILDQRVGGLPPAAIDIVREKIAGAFRDKLGISIVPGGQSYRRPYGSHFDRLPYPQGIRIPKFAKLSGDQGKSTREHIHQFLAQLGELADTEAFRVCLFSLSLTRTAFTWYATLTPNSILSWGDLEQKFHEHFFSGDYELDLVDLVVLRQEKDESVNDYIRRFRDTRNRCFQIHLIDKQLVGIAFDGVRPKISKNK